MKTIDKIITKVDCKYGAPMGRYDIGTENPQFNFIEKRYDCKVPLYGGYDKGGAYWGIGAELRVTYNKSLTFVKFYRND